MIKDDRAAKSLSRDQTWSRCAAIALTFLLLLSGGAQQRYVTLRERPNRFFNAPLSMLTRHDPKPTPRTLQLLRRYDLVTLQQKNPELTLVKLQQEIETDPNPDKICTYAELAYLDGKRLETHGKPKDALDAYATSVAHAYWFLLDPKLDRFRNPYDPEFRRACDLYNDSLASAMRLVIRQKMLHPGETQVIQTGKKQFQVQVV